MNKYVDHLTVDEYKTIREQLKLRLDDLKQGINSEIGKRKYIEKNMGYGASCFTLPGPMGSSIPCY